MSHDTSDASRTSQRSHSDTGGANRGPSAGRSPGKRSLTSRIAASAPRAESVARAGFAGAPAPLPYRGDMEQAFGADFSGVSAHMGPAATQACEDLDASAYTLGSQVAFAGASPSRATVAHELTHVIQQDGHRARGVQAESAAPLAGQSAAHEREADHIAAMVTAGFAPAAPVVRTAPRVAREPKDGADSDQGGAQKSELEATLSSVKSESTAQSAAKKVVSAVNKGELAQADVPALAELVPAEHREAFWSKVASRARSRIRAKLPTEKLPKSKSVDKVEEWVTSSGWKDDLTAWAELVAAWRDALPEGQQAGYMETAVDRGRWLIARFKTPNYDRHRSQKPLRDALNDALGAALGQDYLRQAYQAAGASDLWTVDQTDAKRDYEAARSQEAFDPATTRAMRIHLESHVHTLAGTKATLEGLRDSGQDIASLAATYGALLSSFGDTLMEYKRQLKLGTGQAADDDLEALQSATATYREHSDFFNALRIDAEAAHLKGAGKVKQERGDDSTAAWWQTMAVAGMDIDKNPQQMTARGSSARSSGDIDQAVLHEGGRTPEGTLDTFIKRDASSHFVVNPDGSVGQLSSLAARAGHIPGGNDKSVGVDLTFYDGSYTDGSAADAYVEFLETSPAQIVALCKLILSVRGATTPDMTLNPPTDSYSDRTDNVLDNSDAGVYPHGSATVSGDAHSDPGDLISQEYFKWVVLVDHWERTYGPINVYDEAELTRLQAFMDQVEQQTIAEHHDSEPPYVADTAGTVTAVKSKKKDFVLTIEDPDGQKSTLEVPRTTKRGKTRLTVSEGDAVTAGMALVRVNPYDDAQRELFTAKVIQGLSDLGT